jgi:hypothetical protein
MVKIHRLTMPDGSKIVDGMHGICLTIDDREFRIISNRVASQIWETTGFTEEQWNKTEQEMLSWVKENQG